MIYQEVESDSPLSQGDILDECPILVWEDSVSGSSPLDPVCLLVRVVVLTQACDLAHEKTTRVVVALVHSAQELVAQRVLRAATVQEQVRTHRVYGWYFLPAGSNLPESIADLRDLHTIPRRILQHLVDEGKRVCRIVTPYREHLAQHFSTTYSRIALPEPYETEP